MRADRLVSLMMLLQSRRRATACELARELEVSVRTIYRDVDALSASGVPVCVSRGPHGGVSLLAGWRTSLTGLTRGEVEALAGVGQPGALVDLGLEEALQSGLRKVAAALPAGQQPEAARARERLFVDGSSWFQEREEVPHLGVLRDAVWEDRKVALTYRDFEGAESERVVEPLGLVIKVERWYLVAGTEKGVSVFRGGRVAGARALEERFVRPAGFELAGFWKGWCARFAEKRATYEVTVRVWGEGEEALGAARGAGDRERIQAAAREADGSKLVTVDFEREAIAVAQLVELAGMGGGVEVVAPEGLRRRLGAMGEALWGMYGGAGAEGKWGRARVGRAGEGEGRGLVGALGEG
ncbi:helix-turn-helix transcriptional regulator [Chondromyces crocatus]|uniref:Transcriptional regulator n=1 Tax=Chondromyces crocatus TaxID=52 RepID=A0A0K1EDL3_CHOCO|nr:WYL domain-containing protein [Chondromyces crocatus]AKT38653.1 transcriptional regulator [Chondromyces crocatus]